MELDHSIFAIAAAAVRLSSLQDSSIQFSFKRASIFSFVCACVCDAENFTRKMMLNGVYRKLNPNH